jgi:hypothetical protein
MTLPPKTKTSFKILVILKILIQKLFTGNILQKHPSFQSSMEIMCAAAIGFESGFSGFIGLIITSPVRVGIFLLDGDFISLPPAAA